MLNQLDRALAIVGIAGTLLAGAWLGATAANASPALCGAHKSGDMYIHACAGGGGGGGNPTVPGCQGTAACVHANKVWRAEHPGEDLPDPD